MSDFGEEDDFFKDLEADFQDNEEQDEILEPVILSTDKLLNDQLDFDIISQLVLAYKIAPMESIDNVNLQNHFQFIDNASRMTRLMNKNDVDFTKLLTFFNELAAIIQGEINVLHNYIKQIYKPRFGELETLVPSPLQYSKIIFVLEKNETDVTEDEKLSKKLENFSGISKEQLLVLIMSIKTSFNKAFSFKEDHNNMLFRLVDLVQLSTRLREDIITFLSSKMINIAPNLCAILGSEVTSLLIAHAGGIMELSQIPSCNLSSIGKTKYLSHELQTTASGVRQEGYIYRSDLIQSQPISFHKQLVRMVCAKVALASRVDAGQQNKPYTTDIQNTLGIKWREEVLEKIKKLQNAPDIANVKPLPIPEDKPATKRAGRKFRKYKEQFQLSHMRQLQNRMEFGKQEQTTIDGFGEEIGMGMVNSSLRQATGSAAGITKSSNNNAKLGKRMKHRVEEANIQTTEYLMSLDSSPHLGTSSLHESTKKNQEKSSKKDNWYASHITDQ